MTPSDLDAAFSPSSVAVIGPSARTGSPGRAVFENLLSGGFAGDIHPVNPRHRSVLGRRAIASVGALDPMPPLAVVVSPARTVPAAIDEFGAAGGRTAIVVSGGITDANGLRPRLLAAARRHGVRLLGPGSVGLLRPPIGLNASLAHRAALPGRLALVSQSGAIVGAMIGWAAGRGVGFSHIVSLGEAADLCLADLIDHLAADAEARAILLYLEGITDARRFMSAARAAARIKPVIALKAGRHRDATADAVVGAALDRAGILRIRDLEEMFDAAEILDHPVAADGDRLAVIANGTGAGVLAADAVADMGERLARLSPGTLAALGRDLPAANPIDLGADAACSTG
ncbi:CoA-binding protein [Limibaculum sp. FT325]|uniref:CoA-binding protein n=1 Tax=Thermohalobaculum sediminis TaxID=2939436 RepID=UPI0020BDFCE7|nr:CoA-binding protein [Limibaculum sediminis]MCL5777702.1 CoA-binding protein [Limibaculum sediminis]